MYRGILCAICLAVSYSRSSGGVYKAYSSLLDDAARRIYRAEIIEEHHITQAAVLLGQQAEQALNKGTRGLPFNVIPAIELQPNEDKWNSLVTQPSDRQYCGQGIDKGRCQPYSLQFNSII